MDPLHGWKAPLHEKIHTKLLLVPCSFLGYEDLDVVNPDGSRPEEAKADSSDVRTRHNLLCVLAAASCTVLLQIPSV